MSYIFASPTKPSVLLTGKPYLEECYESSSLRMSAYIGREVDCYRLEKTLMDRTQHQ